MDVVGGVPRGLDRGLGDSRYVGSRHHIADHVNLGATGQAEVFQHHHPSCAIHAGAGLFGELCPERVAGDTGCPDLAYGVDPAMGAVAIPHMEPALVHADDRGGELHLDADADQVRLGARRQCWGEAAQDSFRGVKQNHSAGSGIDAAKVTG